MEWKHKKKLEKNTFIVDFETYIMHSLPEEYKTCMLLNNGGRPSQNRFRLNSGEERVIKTFLSFNPYDKETIWTAWLDCPINCVPIACDNSGNYILLQYDANRDKPCVVFLNHKTYEIEYISDDYTSFIDNLY